MSVLDSFSFAGPPRQDWILLGGQKSPGRANVINASDPRKWDERQGYGYSGAFLVYMGDKLSDVDVIITLWDEPSPLPGATILSPNQWQDWATFAKVLVKAPVGQRPKALGISHPLLSTPPLSISAVVVVDVTQFIQGEGEDSGSWSCMIRLKAFRAPIPVLGRPNQAIPPKGLAVPVPADGADLEINTLRGQRDGLAGKL